MTGQNALSDAAINNVCIEVLKMLATCITYGYPEIWETAVPPLSCMVSEQIFSGSNIILHSLAYTTSNAVELQCTIRCKVTGIHVARMVSTVGKGQLWAGAAASSI